jgi:hypothetical protein
MFSRSKWHFALVAAVVATAACSSKNAHDPNAGSCPPDAGCTGIGGPVGSGTPDAGSDTASADAGEAGGPVTINPGAVRVVSSFASDPATGPLTSEANLVAQFLLSGVVNNTPVSGGTFVIPALDNPCAGPCPAPPFTPLTWVTVGSQPSPTSAFLVRTIAGLPGTSAGGTFPMDVPSYEGNLAQITASALGIAVVTTGLATLVVQVVDDKTGALLKGVVTSPSPSSYDDGADGFVATSPTNATSGRGTALFLGIAAGSLPTVTACVGPCATATSTATFAPILRGDAVTYVRVRLSTT